MTAAKRSQPENKPSSLLNPEENDQLFKLIGARCKVILLFNASLQLLQLEFSTHRV